MDFKNILNDPAEDGQSKRPRGSSGAQSRSNTLPTLHTTPSESPSIARSRTLHDEQYFPLQTSPGRHAPPHLPRSSSYHAGPFGAGSPTGPLPHQMAPVSPYVQSPSGNQSYAPLNRHVSHPSQASTPTSGYPPTPYGIHQHSPVAAHSPYGQAPPLSQGYPGQSIPFAAGYPHPLQHPYAQHQQRRVASTGVPQNMHLPVSSPDTRHQQYPQQIGAERHASPTVHASHAPSSASIVHPMHAPPSIPRSQHSRQSSSLGVTGRERTRSVSVSPKTLITGLPSRAGSLTETFPGESIAPTIDEMVPQSSALRSSVHGSVQPRSDSYQSGQSIQNFPWRSMEIHCPFDCWGLAITVKFGHFFLT